MPALTTEQTFGNLMFDSGVMTATGCNDEGCKGYQKPTKLVPLIEGDSYFTQAVETMSAGLANAATGQTGAPIIMSVHGRSGNTYECLRKGGCGFLLEKGYTSAFDEAMKQVADAKALVQPTGKTYRVGAVTAVHGESDHYANQYPLQPSGGGVALTSYADALVEWQRDYDAGIRALTGQQQAVPLLISQMSNWNDRRTSEIPRLQIEAHTRASGKVVLVGPTYMLPYAGDCIHFTNHGERRLGEYFAKAYARVVNGGAWEPLRPVDAKPDRNTIHVRFTVPKPPLVLDTTQITDPGSYGFEVVDAAGTSVPIQTVQISAPDTVTITLGSDAVVGMQVRYALNATPQTCPGPETGPRGNLRDSDTAKSNYGYDLSNWSVHFEMPVR